MAEVKTTADQIGLTRGKAVLIAVLAVTLVVVLYAQYGGGEAEYLQPNETVARLAPLPIPALSSPAATNSDGKQDQRLQAVLAQFEETRWKAPELTEVVAYDPFALPASFPQPPRNAVAASMRYDGTPDSAADVSARQLADAVERLRRQLEELQQRGVHVIVNQRDEYVAMIGDRTVHVGDEINGFTVTAIGPDGVRVEMKGGP